MKKFAKKHLLTVIGLAIGATAGYLYWKFIGCIRSIPTLIIFRKGEIRWRQSGVFPANELERLINENR